MRVSSRTPDFRQFKSSTVGVDQTDGRFADVSLETCRSCGKVWLRYFVEYEAFSRSGRWARGIVTLDQARAMTPETALDTLDTLPRFVRGGSYFDGEARWSEGSLHWMRHI